MDMPGLSPSIYLRRLLRKTDAEIAEIAEQAEKVAAGATTSISSLSQSASFSPEEAGAILEAVEEAQRIRDINPAAGPASVARASGHRALFSASQSPAGMTWGC